MKFCIFSLLFFSLLYTNFGYAAGCEASAKETLKTELEKMQFPDPDANSIAGKIDQLSNGLLKRMVDAMVAEDSIALAPIGNMDGIVRGVFDYFGAASDPAFVSFRNQLNEALSRYRSKTDSYTNKAFQLDTMLGEMGAARVRATLRGVLQAVEIRDAAELAELLTSPETKNSPFIGQEGVASKVRRFNNMHEKEMETIGLEADNESIESLDRRLRYSSISKELYSTLRDVSVLSDFKDLIGLSHDVQMFASKFGNEMAKKENSSLGNDSYYLSVMSSIGMPSTSKIPVSVWNTFVDQLAREMVIRSVTRKSLTLQIEASATRRSKIPVVIQKPRPDSPRPQMAVPEVPFQPDSIADGALKLSQSLSAKALQLMGNAPFNGERAHAAIDALISEDSFVNSPEYQKLRKKIEDLLVRQRKEVGANFRSDSAKEGFGLDQLGGEAYVNRLRKLVFDLEYGEAKYWYGEIVNSARANANAQYGITYRLREETQKLAEKRQKLQEDIYESPIEANLSRVRITCYRDYVDDANYAKLRNITYRNHSVLEAFRDAFSEQAALHFRTSDKPEQLVYRVNYSTESGVIFTAYVTGEKWDASINKIAYEMVRSLAYVELVNKK